jgi:HK97 family phage prohead protease
MVERKVLPCELTTTETEGEFEGYASRCHNLDDVGDIVAERAFQDSLAEFVAQGFIGGMNHDWDHPIGRPVAAKEDSKGLWIRAALSDTLAAHECRTLMQDGVVQHLSIGFQTFGKRILGDQEAVRAYWRSVGYSPQPDELDRAKQGARLITRARLIEVSPVTVPANRMTQILGVKSERREIVSERDFERFLREVGGFSRGRATAIALHGFKAAAKEPEVCFASEAQALYLRFLTLEARRLGVRLS